MPDPEITYNGIRILREFLLRHPKEQCGYSLVKTLNADAGMIYKSLRRFEKSGWLQSKRENVNPEKVGRPQRRLYWLTPAGEKKAATLIADLKI